MDIKSVVKHVIHDTTVERKEVVSRQLQTEHQTNRDANGQTGGQQDSPGRRLRDGEVEKVIKALSELPGFADNNLTVEVETGGEQIVFRIVDAGGRLVRRLPELEASKLLLSQDSAKGQIFSKAL